MLQDNLQMFLKDEPSGTTPAELDFGPGENSLQVTINGTGIADANVSFAFSSKDTPGTGLLGGTPIPLVMATFSAEDIENGIVLTLPSIAKRYVSLALTDWTAGNLTVGVALNGGQTNV